jgi:hypothetical protein
VSAFLRGQLAQWLALQTDLVSADSAALEVEIATLAATQMGHTLRALALGLPVYDVVFGRSIEVRAAGEITAPPAA